MLATWAFHEVECNSLSAPAVAQELPDAASVENVTAVELQAGLIAKGAAADHAIVMLSNFVCGSALDLEAGQMIFFSLTLAAATSMTAIKFLSTGADLSQRLELRDSAALGKHHREELGFLLSIDEVFTTVAVVLSNEISCFNHFCNLICRLL